MREPDHPALSFIQVRTPHVTGRVAPRGLWLFHTAMGASLLIAALGGIVIGVLAATRSGTGADRWLATVQAHATLQLWGWFATFTTALVFESIVRLNRRPPVAVPLRVAVLLLLAAGSVLLGTGSLVEDLARWPSVGGALLLVVGACLFLWLVISVPSARPLAVDVHPLFFRAGATWLVVAAVGGLVASARAEAGVMAPQWFEVMVECVLRGFIMNTVIAVALRAYGHLGVPEVAVRTQLALWGLVNGGLLLWLIGAPAFSSSGSLLVRGTADILLALTMVWATLAFRIVGILRAWRRDSERPRIMVPLAWVGLLTYAALLAVQAASGIARGASPMLLEAGAARHAFMLGFVAPLLIAMAHVVLDRFGTGHAHWRNALTVAFALLVVAWPLRVVPPLADTGLGSGSQMVVAVAGVVAATALILAAAVSARNGLAVAQFERGLRPRR